MDRVLAGAGALTAVLCVVALLGDSSQAAFCVLALVLTVTQVAALTGVAGGFTPAVIPVLLINTIMLLGYVLWDDLAFEAAVSARLAPDPAQLQAALVASLAFTGALTLGALLARPRSVRLHGSEGVAIPAGVLVVFSYLFLAVRLYGRGSDTLRADQYLDFSGPVWAASLGGALTPVGILLVCYAVFRPGRHRVFAVVAILLWFALTFGASSRQVALLPSMLLLGRVLAQGAIPRMRAVAGVAAVAVVTVVLAQLVLVLRANPTGVGVLTLAEVVWSNPREILGELTPARTLGNVLFSAPLVGRVSSLDVPLDSFWTSISPLPGSWTDWPDIAPQQRINVYTPYAGLGELAAHGLVFVVGFGIAAGLTIGFASRVTASMPGLWRAAGAMGVLALATLFSVTMLQYNLRTGSRLLWYAALGLLALRITFTLLKTRAVDTQSAPAELGNEMSETHDVRT